MAGNNMPVYIIFRSMYLVRSVCTLDRGSAYIHERVRLVLQRPWEAHHWNDNSAGFLADA
jgi:hypothetical protein